MKKSLLRESFFYRGYNIEDIVKNTYNENRFGFEEVVFLLLFGNLPTKSELETFTRIVESQRELPNDFFEDMILKAPSKDIMNKMGRSILALYSYDQNPESHTPDHELNTAISIIAKLPRIMVNAYQVQQRSFFGRVCLCILL